VFIYGCCEELSKGLGQDELVAILELMYCVSDAAVVFAGSKDRRERRRIFDANLAKMTRLV
jgi:hypothetical protein